MSPNDARRLVNQLGRVNSMPERQVSDGACLPLRKPRQQRRRGVSAAVEGKKTAPKRAVSKKSTPAAKTTRTAPKKTTRAAPRKAPANESAPKKQAAVRKPRRVEKLLAGAEVPREFTMTIQVSDRELLADPVAATRRVLTLALAQIPTKIHEEQVDKLVRAKYLFSRVLEGQLP
jgi:hypothetical protein